MEACFLEELGGIVFLQIRQHCITPLTTVVGLVMIYELREVQLWSGVSIRIRVTQADS